MRFSCCRLCMRSRPQALAFSLAPGLAHSRPARPRGWSAVGIHRACRSSCVCVDLGCLGLYAVDRYRSKLQVPISFRCRHYVYVDIALVLWTGGPPVRTPVFWHRPGTQVSVELWAPASPRPWPTALCDSSCLCTLRPLYRSDVPGHF